jgi:hypothetical protein
MLLSTRKLLHFNIKGTEERILPVLLCLQEEDLSYMNSNVKQVLTEIKSIILNNLSEIEKKGHLDCSKTGLGLGYTLLPAGDFISTAYCCSMRNESSSYQLLQYNGSVSGPPVAKFSLTLWICPAEKSYQLHSLVSD